MSRNGERKPPRPRIAMVTSGVSESETAAVIAAIEQFLADTAAVPEPAGPAASPWLRAALEEGIAARQVSGYVWGHAPLRPGTPSG